MTLTIIVCAIALLAAGSLIYNLALLDRIDKLRDEFDALGGITATEYRQLYASERVERQRYEELCDEKHRWLLDIRKDLWATVQDRARVTAERDDALGKLGSLGQMVRAEERWN